MANQWIGKNYDAHRLLLLGESAYSWMEDEEVVHPTPRHAEVLVEAALSDDRGRFMGMLTRAIARSRDPSPEEVAAAWHQVAFMNYIEGTVGVGPRVRPSQEQWYAAATAFRDRLEELQPRNVIVLGKKMWGHMPDADLWLTDDAQGYQLENRSVVMCWANLHPAGGMSWHRLAHIIAYLAKGEVVDIGG